jgi:protein TonB
VLASAVLHLIVLLSQQPAPALTTRHAATMQVTLGDLPPSAAPATEKHQPRPTAGHAPVAVQPVSAMPTHNSAERPPAPVPSQQAAVTAPPTELRPDIEQGISSESAAAQGNEPQRDSLMQLLAQALAQQFRYPPLARKQGWQGEVLLAFTLDTRGTIIDARISRSSGYGALDNAAIASLTRVASIETGPSRPLSFELPVIYRLHGG